MAVDGCASSDCQKVSITTDARDPLSEAGEGVEGEARMVGIQRRDAEWL